MFFGGIHNDSENLNYEDALKRQKELENEGDNYIEYKVLPQNTDNNKFYE